MERERFVRNLLENMFEKNVNMLKETNYSDLQNGKRNEFEKSLNWIYGYSVGMPLSFSIVCRQLGYNPEIIRKETMKEMDENLYAEYFTENEKIDDVFAVA